MRRVTKITLHIFETKSGGVDFVAECKHTGVAMAGANDACLAATADSAEAALGLAVDPSRSATVDDLDTLRRQVSGRMVGIHQQRRRQVQVGDGA